MFSRSVWIWFLGILAFCLVFLLCLNRHWDFVSPNAAAAAVIQKSGGPAHVSLTRNGAAVIVSGLVRSADEHQQVLRAVRSAADANVTLIDRLVETPDVGPVAERFVPLASRFFPSGQELHLGANRLQFYASAPDDAAKTALESDIERVGAGLNVAKYITVELGKTETVQREVDDILKGTVIEFQTASAVIRPSSFSVLDSIAAKLKQYPDVRVKIDGHTDSLGQPAANMKLSQSRADSVRNALVKRGVAASRIESTGYGSTRPLVPETSPENRAKNRRIELVIVK
jgi:outer membrane protein OmpA-like peptidoglycan-associated protein